jgi:pyrroloquinoline quinone biosynthesis protein B
LRQQIEATPDLHPREGPRSSPIGAVIVTNGDVDAVAGLLHLREGTPFVLLAHERVHAALDANPLFNVLNREVVQRYLLRPGSWQALSDAAGVGLGVAVRPFVAPGKVPLYLEGQTDCLDTAAFTGDALGLEIAPTGREAPRLVYLANCARLDHGLIEKIADADLLFMDGTLWSDDEMIRQGVGSKTGARMGHVSMSGPDGVLARLRGVPVGRRVFIHVNNTNPALLADSPERAELEAAGWEVAFDGMELSL